MWSRSQSLVRDSRDLHYINLQEGDTLEVKCQEPHAVGCYSPTCKDPTVHSGRIPHTTLAESVMLSQ